MKGLPGGGCQAEAFHLKSAAIPPHNYKLNAFREGVYCYIWSFVTWITLIAEDKAS
jgi:hypothetical protein